MYISFQGERSKRRLQSLRNLTEDLLIRFHVNFKLTWLLHFSFSLRRCLQWKEHFAKLNSLLNPAHCPLHGRNTKWQRFNQINYENFFHEFFLSWKNYLNGNRDVVKLFLKKETKQWAELYGRLDLHFEESRVFQKSSKVIWNVESFIYRKNNLFPWKLCLRMFCPQLSSLRSLTITFHLIKEDAKSRRIIVTSCSTLV